MYDSSLCCVSLWTTETEFTLWFSDVGLRTYSTLVRLSLRVRTSSLVNKCKNTPLFWLSWNGLNGHYNLWVKVLLFKFLWNIALFNSWHKPLVEEKCLILFFFFSHISILVRGLLQKKSTPQKVGQCKTAPVIFCIENSHHGPAHTKYITRYC